MMNKHIENNNIEECYELINRFKNSILKTYLLFNLQYVLLKDLRDLKLINIESLISNISYSNTIIEISKCFSNENSHDFIKIISELELKPNTIIKLERNPSKIIFLIVKIIF